MWTNASRATFAVVAVAAMCCWVGRASAMTLIDPLDDWTHTAAHTSGFVLDTSSQPYFDGDASRAKFDGATSGTIYYHFPNIRSVSLTEYYWTKLGKIDLYGSADGEQWTEIPSALGRSISTTAYWNIVTLASTGPLPVNTNFLAVTMHSGQFEWTPQIGEVTITFDGSRDSSTKGSKRNTPTLKNAQAPGNSGSPNNDSAVSGAYKGIAMPAPQGFSVVSGSCQAYLDWFPTPGADSYNIERRQVDASNYRNVASDVPLTYFMDTGLKPGVEYYYAVSANISGVRGPKSDEVLATPVAGTILMSDALDDWSNTSVHSDNLKIGDGDGGVEIVSRTDGDPGSLEYKTPGLLSFAVDVSWNGGDMSSQFSVDVSADGTAWTSVPLTPMLPPTIVKPNWLEAVAIPDAKLPANANFVRLTLGQAGDVDFESPAVSDVRITYTGDGSSASPMASSPPPTVGPTPAKSSPATGAQ